MQHINNLTVSGLANIFCKVDYLDGLMELRDNLFTLCKSIPGTQLRELKAHKTLPDLTIRIINEIEKIVMRQETIRE